MNEQVTKLIENLAVKLGTTAEYLWSILVNQAFVSGIKSIFIIALCSISFYALFRIRRLSGKKQRKLDPSNYEDWDAEFNWQAATVASWIGQSILFIIIITFSVNAINAFMNPEFWALNYLLNQVK